MAECNECQKQHTKENNVNGKQSAVIENKTVKPQERVNGSDVTNKRSGVIGIKRRYKKTKPAVSLHPRTGNYHSDDGICNESVTPAKN